MRGAERHRLSPAEIGCFDVPSPDCGGLVAAMRFSILVVERRIQLLGLWPGTHLQLVEEASPRTISAVIPMHFPGRSAEMMTISWVSQQSTE